MGYLKMLSVILDPLSGPSLGLIFLIIITSTGSKILRFLQIFKYLNYITF